MTHFGSKTGPDAKYAAGAETFALEPLDAAEGAGKGVHGGCLEGGAGVLLDGLARLGAHHLSHLQLHEAVERRHAQRAVLLSAQLGGGADLWHLAVASVVLGMLWCGFGAQGADYEIVGIRADAFEEFV